MALNFTTELEIHAPQQQVFDCMTDLDGYQQWMHGLLRVDKLTDGPVAVGSSWREVRKLYGKEGGEVFEVTTYDPPGHLHLYVDGTKGITGKGEYHFDHVLTASADGTVTVTVLRTDVEIDIPGFFFKVLGKMLIGTFRKAMERDHAGMKGHLEAAS